MKKVISILFLLTAITTMVANTNESNYFTMGVRDTLWISPCTMTNGKNVNVKAHFESRVDSWYMTFTYPDGIDTQSAHAMHDMQIPYINSSGESDTLNAALTYNAPTYTVYASTISTPGYWYVNGLLTSYGTVKWEPAGYDHMFDIHFEFSPSIFEGGTIHISGWMSSDHDDRGNYVDYQLFTRDITVIKGNMRGDVNGDGVLNTSDITDLIEYLLHPEYYTWDEYQIAAADVDGNGNVGINDVTALINLIMSGE